MALVMFIWNMDSFKIVFVKDTFKCENRLSVIHFLTKFWSKVVFRKDDFEKYKNFGQKVSLEKTILRNVKILIKKCLSERRFSRLKVPFTKTILKRVHISKKYHKSHVWSKNLKKKNVIFSNFGPHLVHWALIRWNEG